MSMHLRAAAPHNLLPELDRIAEGAMDELFADRILDRAESYYTTARWDHPAVVPGHLSTRVQGTRCYRVSAEYDGELLVLKCGCPYAEDYENCKHLAAFIWLLTKEWRPELERLLDAKSVDKNHGSFRQYLNELERTDLIELLDRFAPAEFRREAALQSASTPVREIAFYSLLRRIDDLLDEPEHYGSPASYEEKLAAILEQLRPFVTDYGDGLLTQLRRIWRDVNRRTENGELYDDFQDGPFDNAALLGFAAQLVYAHADPTAALDELVHIQREEDAFGTFTGFVRTIVEAAPDGVALQRILPHLARTQVLSLTDQHDEEAVYDRLHPYVTDERAKKILSSFGRSHASKLELELCRLIEADEGQAAALAEVEDYLERFPYGRGLSTVHAYYLGLSRKVRGEEKATREAVEYLTSPRTASVSLLHYLLAEWPEETHPRFFAALDEHHPYLLFNHLAETGKIEAARDLLTRRPAIIDRSEGDVYRFYQSYANRFPAATTTYAYARLEVHLQPARPRAYGWVVKLVVLLREVLPAAEFTHLLSELRATYRRRSKLMGMLARL